MYIITWKWDGEKPPTTFYNRMRALGMPMLSAKEALLRSKAAESNGISVFTKWRERGSVTCNSELVAHYVSTTAEYHGARVEQQTIQPTRD